MKDHRDIEKALEEMFPDYHTSNTNRLDSNAQVDESVVTAPIIRSTLSFMSKVVLPKTAFGRPYSNSS